MILATHNQGHAATSLAVELAWFVGPRKIDDADKLRDTIVKFVARSQKNSDTEKRPRLGMVLFRTGGAKLIAADLVRCMEVVREAGKRAKLDATVPMAFGF